MSTDSSLRRTLIEHMSSEQWYLGRNGDVVVSAQDIIKPNPTTLDEMWDQLRMGGPPTDKPE